MSIFQLFCMTNVRTSSRLGAELRALSQLSLAPAWLKYSTTPLSSPLVSLATPAFVGARAGCIPFEDLWTAGLNSYGDVTGLVVNERAWLPYYVRNDDEDMMSLSDIELFNVFARTEVVDEQPPPQNSFLSPQHLLSPFTFEPSPLTFEPQPSPFTFEPQPLPFEQPTVVTNRQVAAASVRIACRWRMRVRCVPRRH